MPPSVALWREDVDELVKVFREVSDDVRISDRDFECDTVDAMFEQRGERVPSLEIASYRPHVSVRFDRREFIPASWLYGSGDTADSEAAYLRIREFLLRRRSRWRWVLDWRLGIILLGVLLAISRSFLLSPAARVATLVAVLVYLLCAIALRLGVLYRIRLSRGHEDTSFVARNGERIVLITLGAAIGAIVQWVAGRVLPR